MFYQGKNLERCFPARRACNSGVIQGCMVKKESAHGGCHGVRRRRRTCKSAKSSGKPIRGAITWDLRMGQPGRKVICAERCRSEPREVKHLSTSRKRNQNRDFLSSGERKGRSPKGVMVQVELHGKAEETE